MWSAGSWRNLAGWSCLFLAVVSAQSEITLYKKEGDEVVLNPGSGSVTGPITSIVWRDGPNIAIQWEEPDTDITYYRHFEDRGSLNISSGEMTIKGLTRDDSAVYTAEINNIKATPTRLTVIFPVPVPIVTKSCDDERTSCILTCEGNTTGVELVTYKWRSDDEELTTSSKEHRVEKENSSSTKEFSCELDNPVSRESSKPIPNPFTTANTPTTSTTQPEGNPKISTGLTVFICLLTAVVVLGLLHRWKAGMWFFQKASMPWEADFWRKPRRQPRDAAESNGTTARQEMGQGDEETAMT
ncbi:uncharacterized protein LOC120798328 [Xiphias gladius]|uniref:uncharacterized protein LOC120798328 n=1 Tax=Xiphias gladius TaxID=8245 RepID=UPI001A99AFC3|nr:uncharacterized protein LOC120798328 [Xiphias gladius]